MQFAKDIDGFTGGVSQQPPSLRSYTQYQEGVNCLPSLVFGNMKRPPMEFIAKLTSQAADGSLLHTINRDKNEKYKVVLTGNASEPIEVFTLDGTKCTVRYGHLSESLVFTEDLTVKAYVTTGGVPREIFKCVSIADHTLIVNTTKVCAMSGVPDTTPQDPAAYAYVKKGVAKTDYSIYIDDILRAKYTTGESTNYDSLKTTNIAYQLMVSLTGGGLMAVSGNGTRVYPLPSEPVGSPRTVKINGTVIDPAKWSITKVNGTWTLTFDSTVPIPQAGDETTPADTITIQGGALTGFDLTLQDNLIRVQKQDGTPFKFRVADSWGNEALGGVYQQTAAYQNLPPVFFDGAIVQISGDPTNILDDYWVKYDGSAGGSAGQWVETRKPGLDNAFNPTTMPHRLVRTGVNQFTFCDIEWVPRKVGDENSCSEPSFIGKTINEIFYYRNRLGVFTGENLVLSKAGDFWNFWPTTATEVLDDDPIDNAASSNEVVVLYHAVPYEKTLLAFGEQVQVQFGSGNASTLTTRTLVSDPATRFHVSKNCKPALVGSNAYIAVEVGNHTQIREYFLQSDGVSFDAADVTAHCPKYIPKNVIRLTGSSSYDLLFVQTIDEPDSLYVYKYYWNGDEKVQSAWGKWTFPVDVLSISVLDKYLYLVTKGSNEVCLHRIDLQAAESGLLPMVCLDRQVQLVGTFDPNTDRTSWTLPYTDLEAYRYEAVDVATGGITLDLTKDSDGKTVWTEGDYSGQPYYVGCLYDHLIELSKFVLKDGNGKPYLHGVVKLRTFACTYEKTGFFEVHVSAYGRETDVYTFSPFEAETAFDERIVTSGVFDDTLVMGDADDTFLTLINPSSLPSIFVNGSFEGTFYARAKKV